MALKAIRAVCNYEYRFAAGVAMLALRKRWWTFVNRLPSRRKLAEWKEAYAYLHDEWTKLDLEHRSLYMKYQDLNDEVRYWETRHAKIMNYIEKKMELDETWGK
jgi:hypothetical protein